ncbi:Fic family protein [Actinocorallia lasiicapitis]
MKIPKQPPDTKKILAELSSTNPHRLIRIFTQASPNVVSEPYIAWDKLRFKEPPGDLSVEEWWVAIKIARQSAQRAIPLKDKNGRNFTYTITDEALKAIEYINRNASGFIGINEQVTNSSTRDRYIVNSLIEEAITSSQLEGAATTRRDAKEMIRSGRKPKTRDERMILNNYYAMQRIRSIPEEKLTVEFILDLHRIITDGTLDNPDAAGRFQRADEDRVGVYSNEGDLLHDPPPADKIAENAQLICDFANGELGDAYIPPVVRAIIVHFAIAYLHPFEDGNGRTSRTLFYWSMLNQGFWLTEFISISRILKGAPGQYARSFLHSEQDEGDLTYFIIYHLNVVIRSIKDLHSYLDSKVEELQNLQRSLAEMPGVYNYRQLAIIDRAMKNPGTHFTAISHSTSHGVARETARQDLINLENLGILTKRKMGKSFVWIPAVEMNERLKSGQGRRSP